MKKLYAFILMAMLIVIVVGCAPGSAIQVKTPVPSTKAGTPAPNGQIDVPAVSIQVNAPGPNPLVNTSDKQGHVAGILMGIWHGFISPVTIVLSFINPDVQMYEVHNDGSQYNLGFFLGVIVLFIVLGALIGAGRR